MKLELFAQQALKSPYFIRKPPPCPSQLLPKPSTKQEKETLADSKKLPIGEQACITCSRMCYWDVLQELLRKN